MKILYCDSPLSVMTGTLPPVSLLVDSSLSRNRMPLFLPPGHEHDTIRLAPAIRISRLGKFIAPNFAPRYYDAVTLMARLVSAGGSGASCTAVETAFDSSAIVGEWDTALCAKMQSVNVDLSVTGSDTFDFKLDVEYINWLIGDLSRYFTLKTGDIIVPGYIERNYETVMDSKFMFELNGVQTLLFKIK